MFDASWTPVKKKCFPLVQMGVSFELFLYFVFYKQTILQVITF